MNCNLCEGSIDTSIHGFLQLPCKHIFHLRCGLASCDRIYSNNDAPQCKVCLSVSIKENTIIPPTNLMNIDNIISLEEAYRISETKYAINKTKKIDEKIKELKPEDIQFWRDYIELSKEEFRLYKARSAKAWKIGKEFKADVSHLTALYNKSFRKYYKQILESEEYTNYKVIISKGKKFMRQFDRYFDEYINPYDLTITQFLIKIGLISENEHIPYLDIAAYESFVPAFNEFDKLYDKKNIFKK